MALWNQRKVENIVMALVLALLCGAAAGELIGAALTQTIGDAARGPGVYVMAERPIAFWASVSAHLAVVVITWYGAAIFWRKGHAPNISLKRTDQSLRD